MLPGKLEALRAYLSARAGQVVTREQLLVDVWGVSPRTKTRTVDTHVSRLRQAGYVVLAVRGDGYRWGSAEGEDLKVPVRAPKAPSFVWTPEHDALLGTLPDAALAEHLGVSLHTARSRRIALDVPPCRSWRPSLKKPPPPPRPPREPSSVVDAPREPSLSSQVAADPDLGRESDPVIAKRYGVSRALVQWIRRKLGKPRRQTPRDHAANVLGRDASARMRHGPELARELGVSTATVYKLRRDLGIGAAPPRRPQLDALIDALGAGPKPLRELLPGRRKQNTWCGLVKLEREGRVVRLGGGMWALAPSDTTS